jgi:hypothetical protein
MASSTHFSIARRHRGVVVVQVVVLVIVLLGCAALSVDVGFIYNSRGEMQIAVDSSALAGASVLKRGSGTAKSLATEYAAKNAVAGANVRSGELAITVGNWDGVSGTFYPSSETDATTPNAIRVVGERPDIPLYFASSLGVDSATVAKGATAVQGGAHCLGIWGLEGVSGEGDITTNSYDIRLGGYAVGNIHANGDICSCSDITLDGGVQIHGDAIYGDGNSLTISGTSYEIWGVVGDQNCTFTAPTFDMVEAQINNDNATIGLTARGRDPFGGSPWDLVLSGNDSLTLAPGKYYFTSVLISGQATLTVTGPTEIYISGSAYFTGGGIINVTKVPGNLVITIAGPEATIDGTAGFYGAVIAPATDIILAGTSTYYGVMMGRTLDFDGTTNIHVEESLVADLFGLESVAPVLVE